MKYCILKTGSLAQAEQFLLDRNISCVRMFSSTDLHMWVGDLTSEDLEALRAEGFKVEEDLPMEYAGSKS